jgi:protein required for attachment to host cells
MKTWVLVAHRGGARLVLQEDEEKTRIIETVDNPEGHAHAPEDSVPGHEGGRSSRDSEKRDATRDHASEPFARLLAEKLQKGRIEGHYDELVLIAAPRFLGVIRGALDNATAQMVRGTLDKDYAGLKDRELVERLDKL